MRKAHSLPVPNPTLPNDTLPHKNLAVGKPSKRKGTARQLVATNKHKITTRLTDQQAYDICCEIPPDHEDYEFAEKLCADFRKQGYLLPKQLPYLHEMAIKHSGKNGKVIVPKRIIRKIAVRGKREVPAGATQYVDRKKDAKLDWYVIAVEPGMDYRVRRDIRRVKIIEGLSKFVKNVIVPYDLVERITGTDEGKTKRTVVRELRFPGYVICRMRYNVSTHHLIKSVRGVFGFLPLPLPDDEDLTPPIALKSLEAAELLIEQQRQKDLAKELKPKKPKRSKLKVGDRVVGTAGAFINARGVITELNGTKSNPTAKITMQILRLPVSVTLSIYEVKKDG